MTDHAPLTDEELDRWLEAVGWSDLTFTDRAVARQIIADLRATREALVDTTKAIELLDADLRASRAEVERLRVQNEGLYQAVLLGGKEQEWLRAEVDRLTAAAGAR